MKKPDLCMLAQWLEPAVVTTLETRRRLKNEWRRRRKLATLETLWLMLAVSLDTQRAGLFEILRLATAQLDIQWSVSVPAFCKARARFSPPGSVLAIRQSAFTPAKHLQGQPFPLARIASHRRGQDHSHLARIPIPLEVFRRPQRSTGIGADLCRALLPV